MQTIWNDTNSSVRQDYVLPSMLFNLYYSEVIFAQDLKGRIKGIRIGREKIAAIRFADETVLLADIILKNYSVTTGFNCS